MFPQYFAAEALAGFLIGQEVLLYLMRVSTCPAQHVWALQPLVDVRWT